MVIILNFSGARKISNRIINNIIFEAKIRNIHKVKYGITTQLSLLVLHANGSPELTGELKLSKDILFSLKEIIDTLQVTGIPTAYFMFELLKMKNHIINYGKIKLFQNWENRGNHIN
jgi:hypothetical protein